MILVNTPTVDGYNITESLGLVRGNTIRAKHLGKDFMAGIRMLIGGEIKAGDQVVVGEALASDNAQGSSSPLRMRF